MEAFIILWDLIIIWIIYKVYKKYNYENTDKI